MIVEAQKNMARALNDWFQTPLGLTVAQEFTTDLGHFNEHLRGELLLQLGNCADNPWLNSLNYQKKWVVSPLDLDSPIQLKSTYNQLPLDRNTLDCVIAPLTLEPFSHNFSLIDEIDRVLKPMGYVIFLCINPLSFWGLALKGGLLSCYGNQKVKMRSPFNLNRSVLQRGYRQIALSNFCYIPPINNANIIKKLSFLDEVGRMLWPFPSGFYCYIAQKYEPIAPTLLTKVVTEPIAKEYKSPLEPALNSDSIRQNVIII